jgi:hypothetical protein
MNIMQFQKKNLILFLLFYFYACNMHPFVKIGKIQNTSSKNICVLLSNNGIIENEKQIEQARVFFISPNNSAEIWIPNIPDFSPGYEWYFSYYDNDSLRAFTDSIKEQRKVSPVNLAYKRYLLSRDTVAQREIEKKELNLIFNLHAN